MGNAGAPFVQDQIRAQQQQRLGGEAFGAGVGLLAGGFGVFGGTGLSGALGGLGISQGFKLGNEGQAKE